MVVGNHVRFMRLIFFFPGYLRVTPCAFPITPRNRFFFLLLWRRALFVCAMSVSVASLRGSPAVFRSPRGTLRSATATCYIYKVYLCRFQFKREKNRLTAQRNISLAMGKRDPTYEGKRVLPPVALEYTLYAKKR